MAIFSVSILSAKNASGERFATTTNFPFECEAETLREFDAMLFEHGRIFGYRVHYWVNRETGRYVIKERIERCIGLSGFVMAELSNKFVDEESEPTSDSPRLREASDSQRLRDYQTVSNLLVRQGIIPARPKT